ncbi:MAG: response regulator [Lysobacterales bacterium]|jgi:CheY-like chemotaxis protein/glycine cleavage system H lipoate-binding protein
MPRDILVVEDEPMVTQAVVMICSNEGISVTAVDNATEALHHLDGDSFRLVLCDIMMQGMDGFQFLEELDRHHLHVPVVMMTGYSTVENAVKSLAMGAIDYIPKPFTADELLTVIRRSLRGGQLLAEAESAGLPRGRGMDFVPCPDDYYRLGYVSWAQMEDEGTARVGVSDLFLKAAEGITELDLGEPGEDLVQGIPCAAAISPDGARHEIMCPLSGKILEVNGAARQTPSLVEKDPYFKGWLYRILPSDPEANLQWLSQ